VYNKRYLDIDLDRVLQELHVDPPLDPPIEGEHPKTNTRIPTDPLHKEAMDATPPFRPSQLATTYLRTARIHKEHVNNTLSSLRCQHEALRIATTSLDLNVLAIMDVFEGISQSVQKELEKQEILLAGVDADLEIISRIKIHTEFLSPATRKAVEAGDRARTLGDYVSNVKMKQVAETCARTHGDLRSMFTQVEEAIAKLNHGTDEVRVTASATGYTHSFGFRETLLKACVGLSSTRICVGGDHRRHSRESRMHPRIWRVRVDSLQLKKVLTTLQAQMLTPTDCYKVAMDLDFQ